MFSSRGSSYFPSKRKSGVTTSLCRGPLNQYLTAMRCVLEKRQVCICAKSLQSCPTLVTLWTVAHHAPLSMGFSRQERLAIPSPPGESSWTTDQTCVLMTPALAGRFFATSASWDALGKEDP